MSTSFLLPVISPFRLDYTIGALRRRANNLVDRWDGKHYKRLFIIDNQPISVMVEQKKAKSNPKLLISIDKNITREMQRKLSQILEKMLGVTLDLHDFYQMAKKDPNLKPLSKQFMGVKPPRFPSVFEALVNAVSCQQISLDAGLQIQNRLVQYVGINIQKNNTVSYAFPMPMQVANCSVTELKKIGYSKQKSETLIRLANAIITDKNLFDVLENKTNHEIIKNLCLFKGIGRWTAEYVLLRGLGKIEIFPGDDVGAQKNLQLLFQLDNKLNYQKVHQIIKSWYPYAGLVYFHLLLDKIYKNNLV